MFEKLINCDRNIFLALNFDGGTFLDSFFETVSGKLTWAPLYILIIVLLWRRYGWKYTLVAVIFMVITVGMVDQLANFFKDTVQKLRPSHEPALKGLVHLVNGRTGGMFGTMSAHAATTFSIMTFSSTLIRARWFTIMMIVWAVLVSYSRIYLGFHYPLDLLFGATAGIVAGVLMARLFRWLASKIF